MRVVLNGHGGKVGTVLAPALERAGHELVELPQAEAMVDFTAPDGVPGFGPFAPDAARDLVARVFGDSPSVSDAEEGGAVVALSDPAARNQRSAEHEDVKAEVSRATEAAPDAGVLRAGEVRSDDSAMQQQAAAKPPTGTPHPSDPE